VIASEVSPVTHPTLIRESVPNRLALAVGSASFNLKRGRRRAPNESWWKTHRIDHIGGTGAP
jgi:hypothetical protein